MGCNKKVESICDLSGMFRENPVHRWDHSVTDLLNTLQELHQLDVGLIFITEALDLTTASGRAMAALLAVFAEFEREILCQRVKAGIAQAKLEGKLHGCSNTSAKYFIEAKQLS
jgi:putative DNA-invertase from lambdoid prophage Rac